MAGIEAQVLEFIRTVYDVVGWPGVVLMMAIESACVPLPSEIIMPLSGWMLIRERGLSLAYLLLAAFYGGLGNLLGSLAAYWVGAWGGRPFLERYGRYFLITQHDLQLADRWFARYGDIAVLVSRVLPVVRTFISLPAGIARMNLLRFSIYTFAGSFVWSLGLAYGGYLLGEHWEQLRAVMRPFDIPIILALLVLLALFLRRRLKGLGRSGMRQATDGPNSPRSPGGRELDSS
ncbi:MAG: DedA family protein [Chloroflexi bacterium]|nr:DedA family protein [Chloroflexota bacterium]